MLAISDISNKLTFDLLTLKVMSESRVTWATNFSLPRPLFSRVRSDERTRQTDRRQTDVRQKHRLMPSPCGHHHHKKMMMMNVRDRQTDVRQTSDKSIA